MRDDSTHILRPVWGIRPCSHWASAFATLSKVIWSLWPLDVKYTIRHPRVSEVAALALNDFVFLKSQGNKPLRTCQNYLSFTRITICHSPYFCCCRWWITVRFSKYYLSLRLGNKVMPSCYWNLKVYISKISLKKENRNESSVHNVNKQESIPVGCEPPACQQYMLHNERVWTCLGGIMCVCGGGSCGPCMVRFFYHSKFITNRMCSSSLIYRLTDLLTESVGLSGII